MTTNIKHRFEADNPTPTVKSFASGVAGNVSLRRTLQVIQPVATSNQLVGRINESHKQSPKRKHRNDDQPKSCKKSRTQIPQGNTECNNENLGIDSMTKEAYQLLVKSKPSSQYWKELAEERRKALFQVLQENERLHKEIELKDEDILKLQKENQDLMELAEHVQYMADMIEKLTGQSADELGLESEQEGEEEHSAEELKLNLQQEAEPKLTAQALEDESDECSALEDESDECSETESEED
ncbi:geminin isoform X1 [Amblyraja radiata]|uniref:geminin isoform X1 n=1 Tax=Amblyraja radiata TaxID=386614 RepID=UPI001402D99B|nr:geminin isoform X1 [Amblyraja radiata]XP_032869350.1 geminin isoform X1 [Amblyraja radiata]